MNFREFSESLLLWHNANPRYLPWKASKDPYSIWLSEIILQQTRVEQGTPYFHKFINTFPSIHDLAAAEESVVMKCWEGLGYYSRARNLHNTARYISTKLSGIFPQDYHDLLKLKGIGPYTAAAIASFAWDKPYAVVDGNVIRFISRIQGITEAVETTQVKNRIQEFVTQCIETTSPSLFNQALMNFGAMICTPRNPSCTSCPFKEVCIAHTENLTEQIPFKAKKIKKKTRFFHLFYIHTDTKILIHKRSEGDIWANLFELPLIEIDNIDNLDFESIKNQVSNHINTDDFVMDITFPLQPLKQILTHQIIHAKIYNCRLEPISTQINKPYYLVEMKKLSNFAFPKIIRDYLNIMENS